MAVKLVSYHPPWWAAKLKNLPAKFVQLVQGPTPIHEWNLPNLPSGVTLSIKRDDLTGNLMSGNKVRKLEFIMAEALEKDSTCVITCGGVQSNHCRATAVAAKQLRLDCHLLLRSHNQEEDANNTVGNMLLNRIHNAQCYLVPYESLDNGLNARLSKLATFLRKQGERPYIVPLGGSNNVGTFGIINFFAELVEQNVLEDYDDIVVPCGSGGTLAGLAVGNYLTGEKLRVHGISVSDSDAYFYQHIDQILQLYGMKRAKSQMICNVIDGYKGDGYAKYTQKDLDDIISICQGTGIFLDYCYTAKAVRGLINEITTNLSQFKGRRILYIHTVFEQAIAYWDLLQLEIVFLLQYTALQITFLLSNRKVGLVD